MKIENPEQFGAKSDVSDWKPKQVFESGWAEKYEEYKSELRGELVFLQQTVDTLRELHDFWVEWRTDFCEVTLANVLPYIIGACLHSSVLSITKLAWDRDQRSLPLSAFAEQIYQNLRNEYKKAFDSRCPTDTGISRSTRDQIRLIRNKRVAHLNEKYVLEELGIDLDALSDATKRLSEYFNKITFEEQKCGDFAEFRTNLSRFIEMFVKDKVNEFESNLRNTLPSKCREIENRMKIVNQLENDLWRELRKCRIDENGIKKLDKWKQKMGKPLLGL